MSLEELAYYVACFGNGVFKITYDRFADFGDGKHRRLPYRPKALPRGPSRG